MWDAIPRDYLSGLSALQFSRDPGTDPERFAAFELTVFGGANSIDIQHIDRSSSSYDVVICNHVIEHVPDDVAAIGELVRVLRPDGWLLLSVPDPIRFEQTSDWGWPNEKLHGHYRHYSLDGLVERIRRASPTVGALLLPTRDPVTGNPDSALALSQSAATLERLRQWFAPWVPDQHSLALDLVIDCS